MHSQTVWRPLLGVEPTAVGDAGFEGKSAEAESLVASIGPMRPRPKMPANQSGKPVFRRTL